MINSIGKHQITTEFVDKVSTLRNTIFLSPLCSCLYPILVPIFTNTKNCCFGSTFTVPAWGFKIKGFSLSAIEDFIKSPGLNSREYYCGLYKGIRTSDVTALFTTNLTIFIEQEVSSSIFLHIILGISILKFSLILFYLPDYYTFSSPLN